jgi:hypothetical protein
MIEPKGSRTSRSHLPALPGSVNKTITTVFLCGEVSLRILFFGGGKDSRKGNDHQ